MKTVIITQARMTSTRLPGKVLRPVAGKALLQHHLERLQNVSTADAIVVATTNLASDDPIVSLCKALGVAVYRGDECDVLSRFYEAAREHRADVVVRVTADCPLIDPAIIDQVISVLRSEQGKFDYASNTLIRSYPRGMDCEAFYFSALESAMKEAQHPGEREHVTPFIYNRPERYKIRNMVCSRDLSAHRWTVDTAEDLDLIEKIFTAIGDSAARLSLDTLVSLADAHPGWSAINSHLEKQQKKWSDAQSKKGQRI